MSLTSPSASLRSRLRQRSHPLLMGIVNVTPDSFYDGGEYNQTGSAVDHAAQLVEEGVDILDVGGESTRPGADPVSEDEEIRRVVPVVQGIRRAGIEHPISVDTRKAAVAVEALEAGADWINDVSGLRHDPELASVAADHDAPVIIMHMKGTPETMQEDPHYHDLLGEITDYFKKRVQYAQAEGVSRDQIVLDPGIGFGKTLEHNRKILRNLDHFRELGFPIMIGHSRKSYLDPVLDVPPDQRLFGTIAVSSYLALDNVDMLRVHDVRPHRQLCQTLEWLTEAPDIEE